ncbi:MAG: hypothetical protein H6581_01005 [Bacteroidia bacterium]|nr:hypothetical protein [Bacteroidia bacterium]
MENEYFSQEELSVLGDRRFMQLKAAADPKIKELLFGVKQKIESVFQADLEKFKGNIQFKPAKFSRGENYHGFAYRVMDFPSSLSGENIFLFRTLFLWGHHFSFHFILKGDPLTQFLPKIEQNWSKTSEKTWLSTQNSPWEWEFTPETHLRASDISSKQLLEQVESGNFLKISQKVETEEYQNLPEVGAEFWRGICQMLTLG